MAYVRAALPICEHLNGVGETFTWEWPEGSLLWNIEEVKDALQKLGTKTCLVNIDAVGVTDEVCGENKFLRTQWRLETTHPRIPTVLVSSADQPPESPKANDDTGGNARGLKGSEYNGVLAKLVWTALTSPRDVGNKSR